MPLDNAIQRLISADTTVRRFSKANTEIAVTITFSYQNQLQTLVLDTVEAVNVNDTSTLTAHPIVDGSEVADHMYKNPVSMTIRGSFQQIDGLASGLLITSSGGELANVQEVFTLLKNEGIKCEIVKLSHNSNSDEIAFKRRSNMVLTGISWSEKINSMDFSFDFTQAMSAQTMTIEQDAVDDLLPNINFPKTKDFTETMISWDKLNEVVVNVMVDEGVVLTEFLQVLKSCGSAALVGLGLGLATAAILIGIFAASGPVGWVAGAVVAVAILAVGLVVAIKKAIKEGKYKIKVFKVYKSQKKTDEEIKRFGHVIENIDNAIKTHLRDTIQIYQIASNEDQECMISVENNYYTFGITRNNTDGSYQMRIVDMNDNEMDCRPFNFDSVLENYEQCNANNAISKNLGTSYVHLVRTQETKPKQLTDIFIVVSKNDPADFWTDFAKLLKELLYK